MDPKGGSKKDYMVFSDEEEDDLDNYECGESSNASAKDRYLQLKYLFSNSFLDSFRNFVVDEESS